MLLRSDNRVIGRRSGMWGENELCQRYINAVLIKGIIFNQGSLRSLVVGRFMAYGCLESMGKKVSLNVVMFRTRY